MESDARTRVFAGAERVARNGSLAAVLLLLTRYAHRCILSQSIVMPSALALLVALRPDCRDPFSIVADYLGGSRESWRAEFDKTLADLMWHCPKLDGTFTAEDDYYIQLFQNSAFWHASKVGVHQSYEDSTPNIWRRYDAVMRELRNPLTSCDACERPIWEDGTNCYVGFDCVMSLCRGCCPWGLSRGVRSQGWDYAYGLVMRELLARRLSCGVCTSPIFGRGGHCISADEWYCSRCYPKRRRIA